jgi:crotonobetainyl-CoA:carnitine CoA-transferase CaiB-like acyl-CoA transferase
MGVTGPDADTTVKAGVPVADLTAGLYATIGVLAALRRAQATGAGERVEVSLAEACASLLANQAMNHLIGGLEPRPRGNDHPNLAPYQVVRGQDRPFAVAATSELQFARLCAVAGLEELPADERFATNAERVAHRDELARILDERFAKRPAAEWVAALNEAGVAAAVINTVGDVLADPDLHAGLVTELDTPDGPLPQLRTPIRLGGAPLAPAAPPPALGEHTAAVRAAVMADTTPG